jgi:tripartite-type tricarboxylate transporter receptor subunit TctC
MHPSHPPFDPIKDFEAGAEIGTTSFVIAVPGSLPVKTLADFIAYAKAHKGQMSYAGSGIGSLVHLASEMFKLEAGVDMQLIPYTGQPPAIADLLAGRDQFMVLGLSLAEPLLKSGQLKALAILDDQRSPLIPDVPTIGEAGYPDLAINGWAGLHAPAGTPKPVIDRMNAVIMDAISNPDVKSQVEKLGWDVAPKNTPAQFEAFVEKELARWAKVIKDAHVKTL